MAELEVIEDTLALYEEFKKSKETIDRWDFPFPLAVFGTLRSFPRSQGNAHLMTARGNIKPVAHVRGFLPHTSPQGIRLYASKDSMGAFEIYFYKPKDWPKVLEHVDNLEGFSKKRYYSYIRTLMELRILPEGKDYIQFQQDIGRGQTDSPGIKLENEWSTYPAIPAWVYSNKKCNEGLSQQVPTPILWNGDVKFGDD